MKAIAGRWLEYLLFAFLFASIGALFVLVLSSGRAEAQTGRRVLVLPKMSEIRQFQKMTKAQKAQVQNRIKQERKRLKAVIPKKLTLKRPQLKKPPKPRRIR